MWPALQSAVWSQSFIISLTLGLSPVQDLTPAASASLVACGEAREAGSRRSSGGDGEGENLMSEAKIIRSTKGWKSLFWAEVNPLTFSNSAFLAVLDGFLAGPVWPAGPSRQWFSFLGERAGSPFESHRMTHTGQSSRRVKNRKIRKEIWS